MHWFFFYLLSQSNILNNNWRKNCFMITKFFDLGECQISCDLALCRIQFWFLNQEILVSWKMIYLYPVVKFCQPVVAHIILFIRAGCNISICNITAGCNFNHWLLVTTCYIQYFVLFQEVGSKLTIWYIHLLCFAHRLWKRLTALVAKWTRKWQKCHILTMYWF